MTWVLLRTTVDDTDDADQRGLALLESGALPIGECVESSRVLIRHPMESRGVFYAEVRWVDDNDVRVPGPGEVTAEPVHLNEFGDESTFSVGIPTVGTGFEPLQLQASAVGWLSVRLSGMVPPNVAQVERVDIVGTTDGTFTVTINGNDYTFVASSNTEGDIRDGLITDIAGGADPVTASIADANSLFVVADVPGAPFTIAVDHSTTPEDIALEPITANGTGTRAQVWVWRSDIVPSGDTP